MKTVKREKKERNGSCQLHFRAAQRKFDSLAKTALNNQLTIYERFILFAHFSQILTPFPCSKCWRTCVMEMCMCIYSVHKFTANEITNIKWHKHIER